MIILATLVLVLNLLDGWSTNRVLKAGGYEKMPLQRWMFAKIGFWPWIVLKGVLLAVATYFLTPFVGITLSLMYIGVVLYNINVYDNMNHRKK